MPFLNALLLETPAPALQAVLSALASDDVAALRLASRGLCSRVTAACPRISLRLGASSAPPGCQPSTVLRPWLQATRRLAHVSTIDIVCSGRTISRQQLDAALRALALRGSIRCLHLRAPAAAAAAQPPGPHAAVLESLLPLRHVLPGLQSLVIDLAVADLAADLAQLAQLPPDGSSSSSSSPGRAASWRQLRHLELRGLWSAPGTAHPAAFAAAVEQLPASFPGLQTLVLHLPSLARTLPPGAHSGGWVAAINDRSAAAELEQQQLAAVAAAAATLRRLRVLHLAHVPDIWAAHAAASQGASTATGATSSSSSSSAEALLGGPAAAHGSASAHSVGTLDALGSCLVRALPQLQQLRVEAAGPGLGWTWDLVCGGGSTAADHSLAAPTAPTSISVAFHAGFPCQQPAARLAAALGDSSSSSTSVSVLDGLCRQLACYSSLPPALLMRRISTLQLTLQPGQLGSAAAVLTRMPCLARLKLTLLATSSAPADMTALLEAAAAGGSSLRSLVLLSGLGQARLPAAALARLAAAVPGLQALRLVGNFSLAASDGSAVAAWGGLRGLASLRELRVHHLGPDLLQLPVSCLPASLGVFEGRRLHLAPATADVSTPAAAAAQAAAVASSCTPGVQLEALHLQHCQLGSLDALASSRLLSLSCAASSWQGGFAAAAEAWPGLRHLTVWCPGSSGSAQPDKAASPNVGRASGCIGSQQLIPAAVAADGAAAGSLQLLRQLEGFKQLQQLRLQHLPVLTAAGLSVLCRGGLSRLRHLKVSASAVGSSEQELAGAVAAAAVGDASGAVASSSSSSSHACCPTRSLKSVVLHVPGRLPAALLLAAQQQQQQQAAGDAAAVAGFARHLVDAGRLQASLGASLPWASVSVVADQPGSVLLY